ncbi:MAG: TRAP transporter large permease [Clostridium sp.]|uniref:TRAP transporter large permease n=1 Tax=Clostridium sp. TaxID=1506 RepID=UPI002A8AA6F2|nr:TRAP transporter large permease [Clostridium sp.]MDY5096857.1 TRAP transporter large permease [Clostridium sp.]
MNTFILSIVILVILILMGIPVAYAMGATSLLYIIMVDPSYLQILPVRSLTGVNSFILMSIPFFMLAAEIMVRTDISRKLFAFARLFIGRFRGGLAFVNVIASTIFGSISGSAIGDMTGLGAIEIDEMEKEGYDKDFAIALSAASSLQSPLIPPSTTAMVYAGCVSISTGAILLGGLGPGLLIGASQIIYILLIRKKNNFPRDNRVYEKGEKKSIVKDGIIALILPLIILGGILGGFCTATEAAAMAVVYSMILGFFVYKNLNFKEMKDILWSTSKTVANIFMIIAFANAFSWAAGMEQIPAKLATMLQSISSSPIILLLIVNVFFILVGMVMDVGAAIILFAPILAPVMLKVGVDPIHFAVLTITNLTMGVITPPVGLVLFSAVSVGKRPFDKVVKAMIPFLVVDAIILILLIVFPQIVIGIPKLCGFM